MGLTKRDETPDRADLDCEPQGEYVRAERVVEIDDVFDDGEPVHYLFRVATIDEEDPSGEGDDEAPEETAGYVRAAATDDRVVVKIPRPSENEERSIPYDRVTDVAFDTELTRSQIVLYTPERTYRIRADKPGKDECRAATEFLRAQVEESG